MTPRQLGRYLVRSLLGEGSMGIVYLAHDPQLDREVAIKTVQWPDGFSAAQRSRMTAMLLQEARLSAGLKHPGIVAVYDSGDHQGDPFIVFERLEGRPLRALLDECGRLEFEAASRIMNDILEAMAYAHDNGVVHRDLKPGNVMVQSDGHARVMDFGIAQGIAESQPAEGPAAAKARICGTPRYMSPEQIRGEPVDARSDVFSLGVLFYEMLAGRHPFESQDFDTLKRAIATGACKPLVSHRPDIDPALAALVARAMHGSPSARFASARQMIEALQAIKPAAAEPANANGDAASGKDADLSKRQIIEFILQKISRKGDFPATSQSMSAVMQAARSSKSSAHAIAEHILKDFALTNRILRLVNSPFYRGTGQQISTISHAVVLLGVDAVVDIAAGLTIFEHFHNRQDLPRLKERTVQALMTAIHAREIARQLGREQTETAFICGMMHHLGRLIVSYYFPEEAEAIERLHDQGLDEELAARRVMRVSFSELGEAVAGSWHLPQTVLDGMHGLPPSHQGGLNTARAALQGIVSYAEELSHVTLEPDEGKRRIAMRALAQKYDGKISLNPRQLKEIMESSVRNAWDISHALRVNLKTLGIAGSAGSAGSAAAPAAAQPAAPAAAQPGGNIVRPPAAAGSRAGAADPLADDPGDPLGDSAPSRTMRDPLDDTTPPGGDGLAVQRRETLMRTLGELAVAMSGPFQINDILMMVLEGIYRGVEFQHVLLALVSPARDRVACRFGLGANIDQIRPLFQFPIDANGGLPARCIREAREIFVGDLNNNQWVKSFSREFLQALRATSMVMLPIVVRETPIGLIFVDRGPGDPLIGKEDMINLRALCGQAVLAIQQSQIKK